MWSEVDGAPVDSIKTMVREYESPGGFGPNQLQRLNRHIKDYYTSIRSEVSTRYHNGKPEGMKLSEVARDIGETAYREIKDFKVLGQEIVGDGIDIDYFIQYIGIRVLENGSGNLFDKIF